MKAILKYRDLFSAVLSLAFVVFVLAGVIVKTLTPPAKAADATLVGAAPSAIAHP